MSACEFRLAGAGPRGKAVLKSGCRGPFGMADRVAAVIVAGGRGVRTGGEIPQQYRAVAGVPMIRTTLALFSRHAEIDTVQPVIHADDRDRFAQASAGLDLRPPVTG